MWRKPNTGYATIEIQYDGPTPNVQDLAEALATAMASGEGVVAVAVTAMNSTVDDPNRNVAPLGHAKVARA